MSKNIQKSIQKCISDIKKKAPHLQISHSSLSSKTSKIVSGCKRPKSLSFAIDRKHDAKERSQHDHEVHRDEAATLDDIDKFLVENFKSLYGQTHDHDNVHGLGRNKEIDKVNESESESDSESSGALYDSPRFFTSPRDPDLCGTRRLMKSPTTSGLSPKETGLSGLLGGSASNDVDVQDDKSAIPEGIEDCIAVLKVSPSPYEDFKRSMKAVLDTRIRDNQSVDWDFMQELLFCYLGLNKKKQHQFILSAFVDLVVVLRQNSSIAGSE